jgi:hypothetical protein
VDAPWFWARLALRAVVFAVVMAVTFLVLSPLEHRRLPWWDAPSSAKGTRSTVAGVLIIVAGTAMVMLAKNGLGDIPGWTALGCFVIAAVGARISAGGSGSSRPTASDLGAQDTRPSPATSTAPAAFAPTVATRTSGQEAPRSTAS